MQIPENCLNPKVNAMFQGQYHRADDKNWRKSHEFAKKDLDPSYKAKAEKWHWAFCFGVLCKWECYTCTHCTNFTIVHRKFWE